MKPQIRMAKAGFAGALFLLWSSSVMFAQIASNKIIIQIEANCRSQAWNNGFKSYSYVTFESCVIREMAAVERLKISGDIDFAPTSDNLVAGEVLGDRVSSRELGVDAVRPDTDWELNSILRRLRTASDTWCKYSFVVTIVQSQEINAAADGRRIYISSQLIHALDSYEEVAFVLGHELAHNCLGHVQDRIASTIGGVMIDAALGAAGVPTFGLFGHLANTVFSRSQEKRADELGLYMMARARISLEPTTDVWSKIPRGGYSITHPSNPERAKSMRKTINEIAAKRGKGQPLLPDPPEVHIQAEDRHTVR